MMVCAMPFHTIISTWSEPFKPNSFLLQDSSELRHQMTRRFFQTTYEGHPDDEHDVALWQEARSMMCSS